MTIDTRAIPENESLVIEGQIVEDIWQLSDADILKMAGPLDYKVTASIIWKSIQKSLRGTFRESRKSRTAQLNRLLYDS